MSGPPDKDVSGRCISTDRCLVRQTKTFLVDAFQQIDVWSTN